jgi:hypothetical protein
VGAQARCHRKSRPDIRLVAAASDLRRTDRHEFGKSETTLSLALAFRSVRRKCGGASHAPFVGKPPPSTSVALPWHPVRA